ncbi:MAG: ABC transporter ATP-binding protein [Pelolinea sp.]|nr:ABC transporter ATP-binding protein [Pelolinea sp.]
MPITPSNKGAFPVISLRKISKAFPLVKANDNVDLDIYRGEIHALLGENGAGKSTLMKVLYGFYKADSGKIFQNGQPVKIHSPQDALDLNIGMVFQELKLIPAFSVAENIALFLRNLSPVFDIKTIKNKILETSEQYGFDIDPSARTSQLSIGQLQKIEIVKLLLSGSRILILDEPTRVLAPHEIEALFSILRKLCNDGFSVVLITHKMNEVMQSADRITILRNGKVAGTIQQEDATEELLVHLMFDAQLKKIDKKAGSISLTSEESILALKDVCTATEGASTGLKNITLEIRPGEIIGVAGVSGNGQKELGDMILGIEKVISGQKILFGEDITYSPIGKIRERGVSFIPEDPLRMAAIPFMTILENMVIPFTGKYSKLGGLSIDWNAAREFSTAALEQYDCSFPLFSIARSLSGGNLQRMIVSRELSHSPRLIVASYLTRGLDVRSAIAARQALISAKNQGAGVLLISEDLDELFSLSDRLIILFEGRISGIFKPEETNPYSLGRLMTGAKPQSGEKYDFVAK